MREKRKMIMNKNKEEDGKNDQKNGMENNVDKAKGKEANMKQRRWRQGREEEGQNDSEKGEEVKKKK